MTTPLAFISALIIFLNVASAVPVHNIWSSDAAPTATIDSGVIIGTTTALPQAHSKVSKFLGIPFAAPPLGSIRFSPPAAPKSWSAPLKTTANGPSCIQQFNDPPASQLFQNELFNTPPPPAGESEDCMFINVWAPATPGGNRTVMFWIHGGGLVFGTNSLEEYDGSSFAAHEDVVIVAANYRTNAFGFPGASELPTAERNLGFLDQRFALEWVQRNIHAFGGSPEKVTIFGESAGAVSVDALITSIPKNPPFRAAIMESGQVPPSANIANGSVWNTLMSELKCTGSVAQILSCARAANASTIKGIGEKGMLSWGPVTGNVTQVFDPYAARKAGRIARVPILTGTNANEGRAFVYLQAYNITNETLAIASLPTIPALSQLNSTLIAGLEVEIPKYYQTPSAPGLKTTFDIIAQVYIVFVHV